MHYMYQVIDCDTLAVLHMSNRYQHAHWHAGYARRIGKRVYIQVENEEHKWCIR